jgi:hypothetical protein
VLLLLAAQGRLQVLAAAAGLVRAAPLCGCTSTIWAGAGEGRQVARLLLMLSEHSALQCFPRSCIVAQVAQQ